MSESRNGQETLAERFGRIMREYFENVTPEEFKQDVKRMRDQQPCVDPQETSIVEFFKSDKGE